MAKLLLVNSLLSALSAQWQKEYHEIANNDMEIQQKLCFFKFSRLSNKI